MMKLHRYFFIALATLTTSVAKSGVYMEAVKRDKQTGREAPLQVMKIQSGMARMESRATGDASQSVVIFKNDAFYFLDHAHKSYFVIDRATADKLSKAMTDAMKQMQAQFATLPPDQRAMLEAMMKQRGVSMPSDSQKKPALTAHDTGRKEATLNLACTVWDIKRDDQLWEQVCVVPMSKVPAKDEFQTVVRKMRPLMDKLSGPIQRQFKDNPMQLDESLASKMRGMPFITRMYKDGELTNEEVAITAWSVRDIGADEFSIPSNFTLQPPPQPFQPPTRAVPRQL